MKESIVESRRGALRRRNMLAGSLAVGLAVALGFGAYAYWQRTIAESQRRIAVDQRDKAFLAQSRFLTISSHSQLAASDPIRATLLALEGLPSNYIELDRPYLPELETSLRHAFRTLLGLSFKPYSEFTTNVKINAAAFSPDGQRIATASGQSVQIRESSAGTVQAILPDHPDDVIGLWFTTGREQLIALSKRLLQIWDLSEQKIIIEKSVEDGKQICGWIYSPNEPTNDQVGVGTTDADAVLTRSRIHLLHDNQTQMGMESLNCDFGDPDISRMQSAAAVQNNWQVAESRISGSWVRLVGINRSFRLASFDSMTGMRHAWGDEQYAAVALSPDGAQLAASTVDGKIVIWDARNMVRLVEFLPDPPILSMSFSGDGQLLMTSSDNRLRIWSRATLGEIAILEEGEFAKRRNSTMLSECTEANFKVVIGSEDTAEGALIEPEGIKLITSGSLGPRIFRDIVTENQFRLRDVALSLDGQFVIIVTESKEASSKMKVMKYRIDGVLLEEKEIKLNETGGCVRVSPDGRRLVVINSEAINLLSIDPEKPVFRFRDQTASMKFLNAAFNANGGRLAIHRSDGGLILMESHSGIMIDEIRSFALATHEAVPIVFDRSGGAVLIDMGNQQYEWKVFPSTENLVEAAKGIVGFCIPPQERGLFALSYEPPYWCVDMRKPPYDTQEWQDWIMLKRENSATPLPGSAEWDELRRREQNQM
jgi:WD40 repeat protein